MSNELIVLTSILALILLLALGVPVAYSLIITSSVGLFIVVGPSAISLISTTPTNTATKFVFTTIPMFILMAEFMSRSGLTSAVFQTMHRWTTHIPGGLAMATTLANGGMAALSGSSSATAATMAKIAVPEMQKYEYDDRLAMGTVSAGGTFAAMIPPSLALIIYGILTETSIVLLFIGGVIPGLLTVVGYILFIYGWVKVDPEVAGSIGEQYSWSERAESLRTVWPAVLLVIAILGGLYSGVVTATEAGALGALGAFLLSVGVYGMGFEKVNNALWGAAETTTVIFLILIGASLYGYFLGFTGAIQSFIEFVVNLPIPVWIIFLIILLLYIAMGTLMDQLAILVLTLPLTFPLVVNEMGFNAVWFGVVLVKTVEIGLVTPPLGLNVYIASGAVDVDISTSFRGAMRFLVVDIVVLALMLLFPWTVTWLPSSMG